MAPTLQNTSYHNRASSATLAYLFQPCHEPYLKRQWGYIILDVIHLIYSKCKLLIYNLPPACLLVFAELISSSLKMEAICSSETSVDTLRTTRHIPEYDTLHNHRCECLKSYICIILIIHQQLWGYKFEEKLYLGVREQKGWIPLI
jgi:hypothetical protein